MCTASSEYSLIKTIVIVMNLLASPKLCNLAVKLPPEPFQKKPGPPASSQSGKPRAGGLSGERKARGHVVFRDIYLTYNSMRRVGPTCSSVPDIRPFAYMREIVSHSG